MQENVVFQKSEDFSVRIVNLCRYMKQKKHEMIMSNQLLRCGTSIGANISEAVCAISKNDFLAKMYIALKECSETEYWLKLYYRTGYLTQAEYNSIRSDCEEIKRLLSSITKSAKTNNSQK